MKNQTTTETWEKDFDREFYEGLYCLAESDNEYYPMEKEVKQFIKSLIQNERERVREETIEEVIEKLDKLKYSPDNHYADVVTYDKAIAQIKANKLEEKL